MKSRLLVTLLASAVVSLSGCSTMVKTNREATATVEANTGVAQLNLDLLQSTPPPTQLASVSDLPYVNTSAVEYSASYPAAFDAPASLNAPTQSVWSLMQQLARVSGYHVTASDELSGAAAGASGGGTRGSVSAIAYQGTLKGLLDLIAGNLDATWKYDAQARSIAFYRFETRVLPIATVPGAATSTSDVGGTSGAVEGGQGQVLKVNASGSQTNYKTSLSVWDTLKDNITPMLSSAGSFAISEPTASITVRDRWDRVAQVSDYVQTLNAALTMQVKVNVVVYRVRHSKSDNRGFNWNVLYNVLAQRAGQFGVSIATPRASVDGLSSLVLTAPSENRNGNVPPFASSQAFMDALAAIGDSSVVTQGTVVTVNNVPAPFKVFQSKGYLAQTTSLLGNGAGNNGSPIGAGATLTPGSVETGFSMNVLPSVQADGHRILLQVTLTLSSLDALDPVESGGQVIQVPTVSGRQLMPRTWMRSGQTLVLAGFEDDSASRDVATPFSEHTWALGGNRKTATTKDALVVVITPVATSNQAAL